MVPERPPAWYERVAPAAWFFACLLTGWALDRVRPVTLPFPSLGWQLWPALALIAGSTLLAAWAIWLFQARGTTVLPFGDATTLLTSGPFRVSRHPLYVALVATLVAFGLLLASLWTLLFAGLLLGALDRFVIPREEARLRARFGDRYSAYAARVRRWL